MFAFISDYVRYRNRCFVLGKKLKYSTYLDTRLQKCWYFSVMSLRQLFRVEISFLFASFLYLFSGVYESFNPFVPRRNLTDEIKIFYPVVHIQFKLVNEVPFLR